MNAQPDRGPPGNIRAADDDRDAVVQILQQAFSEGRITGEEHTERTEAALNSKTYDDLFRLTADLIPHPPARPKAPASTGYRQISAPELGPINAILCEVQRAGPYRVTGYTRISAFMGAVHVDLSEANFNQPVVEFDLNPSLSEIKITVPRGMGVRDETTKSMSDVHARSLARQAQDGQPTLLLRGSLAMSQLKLRVSR